MIVSFFMIFFANFSSVMKFMKITNFHEKTKVCQNHEGSCYYYHTFWNPEKLPFSSTEKNYQNLALLEWGIGGLKKRGAKPASDGGGGLGGVKTFFNKRWMVCHTVMIRCALESPYLGKPFKYLERHHTTHRDIFRANWSQKVRPKLIKTQKFRVSVGSEKQAFVFCAFSET